MKRSMLMVQSIFFGYQIKSASFRPLSKEGYLGISKIHLPIFHEKKAGTSVKSSQNYSASLSPPPIRPMVEKHPLYETKAGKIGMQKRIEECA